MCVCVMQKREVSVTSCTLNFWIFRDIFVAQMKIIRTSANCSAGDSWVTLGLPWFRTSLDHGIRTPGSCPSSSFYWLMTLAKSSESSKLCLWLLWPETSLCFDELLCRPVKCEVNVESGPSLCVSFCIRRVGYGISGVFSCGTLTQQHG